VDRPLRWLRVPVLAVILYFTYRTGELVFRGYDPYYILFSFHGHDVKSWSYAVLAVFLAGVIVFPMAFCRYLCPLGAALWPFSKAGRLRLVRNEAACTGCGVCDRSCPFAVDVSTAGDVRSGECTLCFECTAACPEDKALNLVVRGVKP
jgi:polyferredoxin